MPALYRHPKSKYWYIDVRINGQRIRCSARTTHKPEAQAYLDRIRSQAYQQTNLGVTPARTWKDAVEAWLTKKPRGSSDVYRLGRLASWSQLPLDSLTSALIQETLASKSPGTAARYWSVISAILSQAERAGWLARVPHWERPKGTPGRIDWLTGEEFDRLLPLLPAHTRPLARFAVATGLRRANITRLTWAQIDMGRRVMWVEAEDAKAKKPIGIPLTEAAMDVLNERLGIHPEYVFTYRERPLTQVATKAWRQAVTAIGRPGFTFHGLRHTWASWAVMSGVSLQELAALGGWSTLQMVQRYAHLAPDHLRQAANRVRPVRNLATPGENAQEEPPVND